jgi:hypothetical protein
LLALLPVSAAKCQEETALDRYVASAHPSYHYQLLNTVAGPSYTAYILELTSQHRGLPDVGPRRSTPSAVMMTSFAFILGVYPPVVAQGAA